MSSFVLWTFFYIQEHGEENRRYGYDEVHGDLTMYFSASENITTKTCDM